MADPVHDYDRLQTAVQLVADAYESGMLTGDSQWTKSAEKLLDDFGRLPIAAGAHPWPWDVPDQRD